MKMEFRVLKQESELEQFLQVSCALVGNNIPIAYLRSGRVVGAYIGSKLVGGWALSYPSPGRFRCAAVLPAGDAKIEVENLTEKGLLCEFTQIFLEPNSVNSRQSIRFWMKISEDVLLNAAPNILFGYKTENSGLGRLYSRLKPRTIYSGPAFSGSSLITHSNVTIMLLKRDNFKYILFKNIGETIRRLFGKKRDRSNPAFATQGTGESIGAGKLGSKPGTSYS